LIKAAGKGIVTLSTFILVVAGQGNAEAASEHTVSPGETLWKISQQYQVSLEEIVDKNQLDNPDLIISGQKLIIPGTEEKSAKEHKVETGETLWAISGQYTASLTDIYFANELGHPAEISPGEIITIPDEEHPRGLTWSELDLFARLVYSEATGEPYEGQVAVAASVLNRVDSSRYPGTLSEVIYQVVGGHYQYAPVRDGRIGLTPDAAAFQAARDAVNGWDPSNGATGFYNPAKTSNQWVRQQPVATTIANHVFFH